MSGYRDLTARGSFAEATRKPTVDATGPAERSRANYQRWLEWAKRALPAEHAPFAASAAMTIKARGGKPTAENVRARLADERRALGIVEETHQWTGGDC